MTVCRTIPECGGLVRVSWSVKSCPHGYSRTLGLAAASQTRVGGVRVGLLNCQRPAEYGNLVLRDSWRTHPEHRVNG